MGRLRAPLFFSALAQPSIHHVRNQSEKEDIHCRHQQQHTLVAEVANDEYIVSETAEESHESYCRNRHEGSPGSEVHTESGDQFEEAERIPHWPDF